MQDNPIRVAWADTLWRELLSEHGFQDLFPTLKDKLDSCVTVGYPPTKARGKRGERRGAYIGQEWQGNEAEKAFVTIHPERLKDGFTAARALFEEMYKRTYSPRRYNAVHKQLDREWNEKLRQIVESVGEPPAGYAKMAEPQTKQPTRLRKYVCDCEPSIIVRVASDKFKATCNQCNGKFSKCE